MNQSIAEFNVLSRDALVGVIAIHGELTSAAETALNAAVSEASGAGAQTLVLDFSQMEYMNSTGIGLLVTQLVRANRAGKRLAATGLNDHYREIFALTRLEEAFAIYPSLNEALSVLQAKS
jgi:anti-sigma B factor antagonist